MIVRNDAEHWAGCDICGEQIELSRKVRSNPETLLLVVEELQRDHRDCEHYKHDPRTAVLQRALKLRMREEFRRIAARESLICRSI